MHIECVVWPAVPGGVHHVFQVEYESYSIYLCVGDIQAIVNTGLQMEDQILK
jgi:hypothetical protein